jgi:Zn-dependent peptidase ImmA (M78 family)/DNA-binding XRE family transcriptional regulator
MLSDIFSKRLKNARLMKGFSMDCLCDKIDSKVSKNAIAKYERGEMIPSSSVLIMLADALNVKVDYFFRPFTVSIDSIEFRKRARLKSAKALTSIKENICDLVERYVEIENVLDIPNNFSVDFSNVAVASNKDVYSLVQRLRNEWDIGNDAIANVIELLEARGVKVIEIEADSKFDGLSGYVNDSIPIIVINSTFNAERKRFTALHELGHLLLTFSDAILSSDVEKMCNIFASEMLIPKEVFIRQMGFPRAEISLKELKHTQKVFGISVDAQMYKARELNIITENRYRTFHIKKNYNEVLKAEIRSSVISDEHSHRFESLVYRALASEFISNSKASSLLNTDINTVRENVKLL